MKVSSYRSILRVGGRDSAVADPPDFNLFLLVLLFYPLLLLVIVAIGRERVSPGNLIVLRLPLLACNVSSLLIRLIRLTSTR